MIFIHKCSGYVVFQILFESLQHTWTDIFTGQTMTILSIGVAMIILIQITDFEKYGQERNLALNKKEN